MSTTTLEKEDLLDELRRSGCSKVKVAIVDTDGVLRGKVIHIDKFLSAAKKGFGFCDVVFGWDSNDQLYDTPGYTGWHTGYPDCLARIDLSSFRRIPWEGNIPFFLADLQSDNGDLEISPRTVLRKTCQQAAEMGYQAISAQEFEWFNFQKYTGDEPEPMSSGMFGYSVLRASQHAPFFHDLFDLLAQFDVPLEGLHTETGPGVYEAAILYGDAMEAGDRAALFKTAVKEIGYRHGLTPSFMAKWSADLPGCSGHVHQSLRELGSESNAFYDDSAHLKMSRLMRHYIAGQLHCLPHILPLYAPTVNSYKRFVEGFWAPTTVSWGMDNRTVAFRVLVPNAEAARIETRVTGSDVNPYLAMAASIASGLYGIKNALPLDTPASRENACKDTQNGVFARNLGEATQVMKESALARELFGDAFVDHFVLTREWEWKQYLQAVTDWELNRYFEII